MPSSLQKQEGELQKPACYLITQRLELHSEPKCGLFLEQLFDEGGSKIDLLEKKLERRPCAF